MHVAALQSEYISLFHTRSQAAVSYYIIRLWSQSCNIGLVKCTKDYTDWSLAYILQLTISNWLDSISNLLFLADFDNTSDFHKFTSR